MLRAVLIGVGRHRFEEVRELASATRDARALRAALVDANPEADIALRVDAEATSEAVRALLERVLGEASAGDEVLIAFAGHGSAGGRIVLHDSDPRAFEDTTIALDELAVLWHRSAAARVILVLDCCFAGGASARAWTPDEAPGPDRLPLDDLPGRGRLVLAAASANEEAYEDPSTRFGLLTQALLDAGTDPAQSPTAMAFLGRVQDEVVSRAASLMKIQTPVVIGEADGDFRFPALRKGRAFDEAFPARQPLARRDHRRPSRPVRSGALHLRDLPEPDPSPARSSRRGGPRRDRRGPLHRQPRSGDRRRADSHRVEACVRRDNQGGTPATIRMGLTQDPATA